MNTRTRTTAAATKATLGLTSVETHTIVVFGGNSGYLSNQGQYAASSGHGLGAAGYEVWSPIFLTAGTYDRLGVYSTIAAVSTWRMPTS